MSVFFVQNSPLVPAFVRNRPPFTSVHSHAGAQKSSGAFFHDMDRERCRKRPARGRNALRASAAVHARDVMVNTYFILMEIILISGSCLCGAVKFTIKNQPENFIDATVPYAEDSLE